MVKKEKLDSFMIDGIEFKTQLTEKFKNRKAWQEPDYRLITAYLPGNILKVFAKDGQKVKKGTKLLILEAMKMKNIVASPENGIIKKVHITEGVMVPKNKLLIELE